MRMILALAAVAAALILPAAPASADRGGPKPCGYGYCTPSPSSPATRPPTQQPTKPPAPPAPGPELPVTGQRTATAAAGAGLLLLAGGACLVAAGRHRRRRGNHTF